MPNTIYLHVCCAPCAIYPLHSLRSQGFDVTAVFYNHNIHPYKEYQKRLDTVRLFTAEEKLPLIVSGEYDLEEFLANVASDFRSRCNYCYTSRLQGVAARTAADGARRMTTSLLVSPYQKHDMIVTAGRLAAQKHGIEFYYEDFRIGWRTGSQLSRERNYYRQGYCGCVYSEKERYCK